MNQKGFISIVIGIVIAVVLLGGGYLVFKNKTTTNQKVENTASQSVSNQNQVSSKLEITSPRKNDEWQIGKNYDVTWRGGEGKISIFLDDKTRETRTDVDIEMLRQDTEARKLPTEVLKGNIWYHPNLDNTGSYSFSVGSDFGLVKGPFRFYVRDEKGNSTFSEYFSVVK